MLHVYVQPPPDSVRAVLAAYQEQLPDPSAYGMTWQPTSWAHLTAARLEATAAAPRHRRRRRLLLALAQQTVAGGVPAEPLRLGPPLVGEYAVEAWVEPSEAWSALSAHVRAALVEAGLDDQVAATPARPHLARGARGRAQTRWAADHRVGAGEPAPGRRPLHGRVLLKLS